MSTRHYSHAHQPENIPAFPILCVVSPVQCGEPGFVSALVLKDFDNCYGKSQLQGFFFHLLPC